MSAISHAASSCAPIVTILPSLQNRYSIFVISAYKKPIRHNEQFDALAEAEKVASKIAKIQQLTFVPYQSKFLTIYAPGTGYQIAEVKVNKNETGNLGFDISVFNTPPITEFSTMHSVCQNLSKKMEIPFEPYFFIPFKA